MKPQDEFLLMTFDEKVQVRQNFTQDAKKVEDQLRKLNEVGNATHLYESVVTALEKMKKSKYKRRGLVVITDAYDTSGKELQDLRAKIAEQEIQVFTCGFRSVYEEVPNPTAEPLFQLVLRVLSGDTGGLSMVLDLPELQNTSTVEGLIGFAQIIALELRGQYTLTYMTDQTGPLASRFVRVVAGARTANSSPPGCGRAVGKTRKVIGNLILACVIGSLRPGIQLWGAFRSTHLHFHTTAFSVVFRTRRLETNQVLSFEPACNLGSKGFHPAGCVRSVGNPTSGHKREISENDGIAIDEF
jgi:hypothetical protein